MSKSILAVLFAALLVGGGIAVLAVVLRLMLGGFCRGLIARLERLGFRRREQRRQRGDAYLAAGDVGRALREFRTAFFLSSIRCDRALVEAVHNHHASLLSRFIAITEERQGGSVRLMSLAKAEHLVAERTHLLRRHFVLRARRAGDGQLRAVRRKLRVNRRELRTCLSQLVAEAHRCGAGGRFH